MTCVENYLTAEQTEQMTEAERIKLAQGFEFIYRRIKEIASYHETIIDGRNHGNTFNEERFNVEFCDEYVRVDWNWDEYGSYQYHENHYESISISLDAIFSPTEEEKIKQAQRAENQRIESARKAKEDAIRQQQAKAAAERLEREERMTYERLRAKYG